MAITKNHCKFLAEALEDILGKTSEGSMAYIDCLTPQDFEQLAADKLNFNVKNYKVYRVSNEMDEENRTITADKAVEFRESKKDCILLLVDKTKAGAGMDGIYSAVMKIEEKKLLEKAIAKAQHQFKQVFQETPKNNEQLFKDSDISSMNTVDYYYFADLAIKKAKEVDKYGLTFWKKFDYLVTIINTKKHPFELLHMIGLWPIKADNKSNVDDLKTSRIFVERLLTYSTGSTTVNQRIQTLRLINDNNEIRELEQFLYTNQNQPVKFILHELANKPNLWVNVLETESNLDTIKSIELVPWQIKGKYQKWSGLTAREDDIPEFIIDLKADSVKKYSKLEVRWKTVPANLKKGQVEYEVVIESNNESLTSKIVSQTDKPDQKVIFNNEDFTEYEDSGNLYAKVIVSVVNNENVEKVESEEFLIKFEQLSDKAEGTLGRGFRTFVDGLIEQDSREVITTNGLSEICLEEDKKGFVQWREGSSRKVYKVFRPALIGKIDKLWLEHLDNPIGRWQLKIRSTGIAISEPEYIPITTPKAIDDSLNETKIQELWEKLEKQSKKLAQITAARTSVGLIIDKTSKSYNTVKDYLDLYNKLLSSTKSELSLANTIEVIDLSNNPIGLIVLPTHFMRLAWQTAYDNLVLSTRYDEESKSTVKEVQNEFKYLDGSLFPAFLPCTVGNETYIFNDTLGFHTVGMVKDSDPEPKNAIALLAIALGEDEDSINSRSIGKNSADVIGAEVLKYVEAHPSSRVIKIHSINPGDGLTVTRALGHAYHKIDEDIRNSKRDNTDTDDNTEKRNPQYLLNLYSLSNKNGMLGRFLSDAQEKRRSVSGTIKDEDRWMFDSVELPGHVNMPNLRWYKKTRKNETNQDNSDEHDDSLINFKSSANVAIAFDMFNSRLEFVEQQGVAKSQPVSGLGLISYYKREYTLKPSPCWTSYLPDITEYDKDLEITEHLNQLIKLQKSLNNNLKIYYNKQGYIPCLKTEIEYERECTLKKLHDLSNWVITVDRNSAIEYFDSPKDNEYTYSRYVIDCVPEREDLGNLQLITSTSSLEEVQNILDATLQRMGLSRTRRNAEFLLDNLKKLSGRLAMKLTGTRAPSNELIALALAHAYCLKSNDLDDTWFSLKKGFFIPVDDILDLVPVLKDKDDEQQSATRPDLIYVTLKDDKLLFRFAEIKYHKSILSTGSRNEYEKILNQTNMYEERWLEHFNNKKLHKVFKLLRQAKLARILRFYLDKAHRHYLEDSVYEKISKSIDTMVVKSDYLFAQNTSGNRGWIFCPEQDGSNTVQLYEASTDSKTSNGLGVKIFRFGPNYLPDKNLSVFSNPFTGSLPSYTVEPTEEISKVEKELTVQKQIKKKTVIKLEKTQAETDISICSVNLGTMTSGADINFDVSVKGNPHLLVVGLPGMGKTHCLINICKQMVEQEVYPIIFSYHTDLSAEIQDTFDNAHIIDFDGLNFNPMHVFNPETNYGYLEVASNIRDIFLAIFTRLSDMQGNAIYTAIKESFLKLGWGNKDIDSSNLPTPAFSSFYESIKSNDKLQQNVKNLIARLDELADYHLFKSSDEDIDFWSIKAPIIVRIHTVQDEVVQRAFAFLVFYHIYKTMQMRGQADRITHAVVIDEAHRASKLKLLPVMAKESRKYGISVILASQEVKDFDDSVYSAVGNFLCLQVNDKDASAITKHICDRKNADSIRDKLKSIDKYRAIFFSEKLNRRPIEVRLKE